MPPIERAVLFISVPSRIITQPPFWGCIVKGRNPIWDPVLFYLCPVNILLRQGIRRSTISNRYINTTVNTIVRT